MKMVSIKYWVQETMESGRWIITKPMCESTAKTVVDRRIFDRAEILEVEGNQPLEDPLNDKSD